MIFSKDKRPTEAGWYWACWGTNQEPFPVQILSKFDSRDSITVDGATTAFDLMSWGDKIEIPTVEDSSHAASEEGGKDAK